MTQTNEIFIPHVIEGVHAGALKAIETARRTNTKLVIWRDGKSVEITPEEAEAMIQKDKGVR